jgi:hypothetical protein
MDDPIKLWATPDGRYCWLTAPNAQPPFKVTVFDGPTIVKNLAFEDHDSAAECAIAEMKTALHIDHIH